jgi:imidazole glycerol-phosphate synthase subunit HisF
MLQTRVMPCLLYYNRGLYKTIKFKNPSYIGDPINAIKIYNEKEVDELIFLDITATTDKREPNYKVIADIASECFMPLCYGGGVSNMDQVRRIMTIGVEKISLNTSAIQNPSLVTEAANAFGNQAVIVSIDVKKNFWGKYEVVKNRGTKSIGEHPVAFAKRMEELGAGEILLTSVDNEGTWNGYDITLIEQVTSSVNIPVIANGGAGSLEHLELAKKKGYASGLAMGSMVVYQKKGMGVLINFPTRAAFEKILEY